MNLERPFVSVNFIDYCIKYPTHAIPAPPRRMKLQRSKIFYRGDRKRTHQSILHHAYSTEPFTNYLLPEGYYKKAGTYFVWLVKCYYLSITH